MSLRMQKVDRELRRRISEVIRQQIDDPVIDFLSITRVVTTADLQESKIYFSLLDETKYIKAQAILNNMKGLIRSMLGKKIRLKILPQLHFIPDGSIKYSVDICQKIEEVKKSTNRNDETATSKKNRRQNSKQ